MKQFAVYKQLGSLGCGPSCMSKKVQNTSLRHHLRFFTVIDEGFGWQCRAQRRIENKKI
jgi:hypothetical protein